MRDQLITDGRNYLESIVFWLFFYLADFRLQSATRAIQTNDKGAADDKAACLIQAFRTRGATREESTRREERERQRKKEIGIAWKKEVLRDARARSIQLDLA